MALARYEGVAQDRAGNVIPFATIEVRKDQPGRPVVPLFSDRNGTVGIGNPITANELGQFGFHVLGGVYYIRVFTGPTQAPFQQFTKRYVAVGTAAERDVEELASSLNAGMGIFATFAGLELFTPEADNVGARVINDPNPALNGDYLYVTDTWVKQRGLPDTLARMEVTGGTADAIEASITDGVDGAAVVMLLLTPEATNTGPVTINGIDLVAFDGAPLEAGWLEAGVPVLLFANGDGDYQLTSDVRFQSLAAETFAARDEAITARDKAEEWADKPEDAEVEAGKFSALHWAAKSEAHATASVAAQTAAETAQGLSEAARDVSQAHSEQAEAEKDAAVVAAEASGDVEFFDTKADAMTALGGLGEGQVVRIFADESKAGAQVFYRVEAGALVEKVDTDERTRETISGPFILSRELLVVGPDEDPETLEYILSREARVDAFLRSADSDDSAAILRAIDWLGVGGGRLLYRSRRYLVSQTILTPYPILHEGCGYKFLNDYTSSMVMRGTVIEAAPGTNDHLMVFRAGADPDYSAGYPRLFAGMRGILVHGNKSASASPTAVDLNATGDGIRAEGVSYLDLKNVAVFRSAGLGVRALSHDYGDGEGARSCNNLDFEQVLAIQNAGGGFSVSGGDSLVRSLIAGNNGATGISVSGGIELWNSRAWNNLNHGIAVGGPNVTVSENLSYDNEGSGFVFNSLTKSSVLNNQAFDNGVDVSGGTTDKVGFVFGSGCDEILFDGNKAAAKNRTTQLYGMYSNVAGIRITLGDNDIAGNTSAYNVSDWSNIRHHTSVPASQPLLHPGFKAESAIDMDDKNVFGIHSLAFNTWGAATFSAGTLACGGNATVTVSVSGGGTVTDITSTLVDLPVIVIRNSGADPVIFDHNTAKLRLLGGADITLNQHEALMFMFISGTVWQQIGGKN